MRSVEIASKCDHCNLYIHPTQAVTIIPIGNGRDLCVHVWCYSGLMARSKQLREQEKRRAG